MDDGNLGEDWKTAEHIDEQYILNDGDILFARSGATVGKSFIYKNSIGKAIYAGYLIRFQFNREHILPCYAYSITSSVKYKEWVEMHKGRTAQPNINGQQYSSFKIPVPPIDVQKQIVEEIAKVDKSVSDSMLRIDKYESDIESLLSSLRFADSTLNAIAPFATKSIKYSDIESETYITTDNMLQNKLGVLPFEGIANISSITEYKPEDILISNIRPYLKKIWFADKEGGCSKDVLVLRSADANKYLPKYIFYMLRRDAFFDYVMEGKKGIKMPRGNKEDIMKYKIPMPNIDEQKRIVAQIEALELEITKARTLIESAASEKQAILDKYL